MNPDERHIVRCPRATEIPACPAQQRVCHDCPTEIWVGPTFTPHVDAGLVEALCPSCFLNVDNGTHELVFRVLPEQEPEYRRRGVLDDLRRIGRHINTGRARLRDVFDD